ncbi:MAG: PAS domain-containing protein, partial [bacterium]
MNNSDYTILICDSDPTSLERIRNYLNEEQFRVWCSTDPGEMLRIYNAGEFDLLILDVRIYAQLRRRDFKIRPLDDAPTAVIALTTDEDFDIAIEAINDGAIDFLEKPVRVKRLLVSIRNAIQQHRKIKEIRKEQRELASLKELYEHIINGIDYGIVVLDQDLRIESINEFIRRKQREDNVGVVGQHCYKFFYNRRYVCNDCRIREVFAKKIPVRYNIVHKGIGGVSSYLEVEAFPLFDFEGRITRVVQLVKDVTERVRLEKELREKKEYLENLFSHAPVGIFTTDQDGFIKAVNPAFAVMIGVVDQADALGLNVYEMEEFRKSGLSKELKRVLVDGIPIEVENANCHSQGRGNVVCSVRCVPLKGDSNKIIGLIGTVADVTEKYQLEETYRKRIAELSIFKEIGELLQSTIALHDIYAITLIGVTAGMGLGFNRAFLLLYDRNINVLVGEAAIGPSNAEEAGIIWSELYEQQLSIEQIFEKYKAQRTEKRDERVHEIVRQMRIPLNWEEGLLNDVLFRNKPQNIHNSVESPFADAKLIAEKILCKSFAIVPLISRGKAEGVVIADNLITGKPIVDEDVNRLSIIANQAGSAIENSKLLQKLEEKVEA